MPPHYWSQATAHLSQQCRIMAAIIAQYEGEGMQTRSDGFYTLLRAVVGQQISVKAADSVWAKLVKAVKPLAPEILLRKRDATLRACGLSGQKVLYAKNVARFFVELDAGLRATPSPDAPKSAPTSPKGEVFPERRSSITSPLGEVKKRSTRFLGEGDLSNYWAQRTDHEIIRELTTIKGIGTWTAEMFLIFHLARPDVLPLKDIGLLKGIDRHYGDGKPLKSADYLKIAENWRPYRTVATWYLWRVLDPVPVAY